jgi:hypothetical protein
LFFKIKKKTSSRINIANAELVFKMKKNRFELIIANKELVQNKEKKNELKN